MKSKYFLVLIFIQITFRILYYMGFFLGWSQGGFFQPVSPLLWLIQSSLLFLAFLRFELTVLLGLKLGQVL